MALLALARSILVFLRHHYGSLIRGGLTFLDNTLVYLFDKTPRRGPLFASWDVTFKCNARCSFCSTHELDAALPRDLNTEESLQIVRQLGESGVWHLSLTGGETLVRKDLPLIIREAKKHGMLVNVNTNGFLLERFAEVLIESGVDSITISVDSDKAEVHDTARVIPGLTEAILKGVDKVKRLRKTNTPQITFRMVISKQSYQDIDNYIQLYEDRVDNISFQPIHDGIGVPKFSDRDDDQSKTGLLNLKDEDPFMFTPKDRSHFSRVFSALLRKHVWINRLFFREIENFLFDKDLMWERYKCYSGYYYLQINPYGEVFPCPFLFFFVPIFFLRVP